MKKQILLAGTALYYQKKGKKPTPEDDQVEIFLLVQLAPS